MNKGGALAAIPGRRDAVVLARKGLKFQSKDRNRKFYSLCKKELICE